MTASGKEGSFREIPLERILMKWLDGVNGCIEDLRDLGVDGFDLTDEQMAVLRRWGGGGKPKTFSDLTKKVAACQFCDAPMRLKGVMLQPPAGKVRVLFVGDMPDRVAVRQGSAIGGETGALLWNIIHAMKLNPDTAYVTNLRQCRFPDHLRPEADAELACVAFLGDAIRLLAPEAICALGETAGQALTGEKKPLAALRGRFSTYQEIPLMVTHHPADLLATPALKRETWQDVQEIMKLLAISL